MNRIAYWALPLLMIGALGTSGFAQAAAAQEAKAPEVKWTDTKEYEDYRAVYDEMKDFVKKATLAEKFFVDHPKADPIALTDMYRMLLRSYLNSNNWAKTIETVERASLGPNLTADEKKLNNRIGLVAATNLTPKNNDKIKDYAEKVLKDDPNDLNALVTLSGLLSQSLPAANPAKDAHITKTIEITRQALAVPKPDSVTPAQWNPIQQQLHDTMCLMFLNQTKYSDSIAECQAAIKINPKDAYAYYWIGLSHRAAFIDLNKKYNEAVEKYNAGRTGDPIAVDELKNAMDGALKVATDKLNETLESFAKAAAAGGDAGTQALNEMKKLFQGTPDELNRLIEESKGKLGN